MNTDRSGNRGLPLARFLPIILHNALDSIALDGADVTWQSLLLKEDMRQA